MHQPNFRRLTGYDNRGSVHDMGEYVLRKVNPEFWQEVSYVYQIYRRHDLRRLGIVETLIDEDSKVLLHKRLSISYPFEWTANMFKDALLFHLDLLVQLEKHGLTLKDALPGNVLFHFCHPVFVDFHSLIPKSSLPNEAWLCDDPLRRAAPSDVIKKMFIPYFVIPLLALTQGDYSLARRLLSEHACNSRKRPPSFSHLIRSKLTRPLGSIPRHALRNAVTPFLGKSLSSSLGYLRILSSLFSQIYRKPKNVAEFARIFYTQISHMDVTPRSSGYASFYEDKGEAFDFTTSRRWGKKQETVFRILSKHTPTGLIDLGANTGWFSILAESLGYEVIATDSDECVIDRLYRHSRKDDLRILPLVLPFQNLSMQLRGMPNLQDGTSDQTQTAPTIFFASCERFSAPTVLCLGLFHHLVLGIGNSIENIFNLLSHLCKNVLLLEYIDLNDELIRREPSFFPKLRSHGIASYAMDSVIKTGLKHFRGVEILPSHPETRKLLVFQK